MAHSCLLDSPISWSHKKETEWGALAPLCPPTVLENLTILGWSWTRCGDTSGCSVWWSKGAPPPKHQWSVGEPNPLWPYRGTCRRASAWSPRGNPPTPSKPRAKIPSSWYRAAKLKPLWPGRLFSQREATPCPSPTPFGIASNSSSLSWSCSAQPGCHCCHKCALWISIWTKLRTKGWGIQRLKMFQESKTKP